MQVNGSIDLKGIHGTVKALDLECARLLVLLARSPRFQMNEWVL